MPVIDKKDILSTTTEGGEIRFQLGDSAANVTEIYDAVQWSADGFFSRPKPPDNGQNGGACMALYQKVGNERLVVGTKDNRIVAKYGAIAEGDRAIVGYSDARFILKDASDSLSWMTKNHASSDETMVMQMNGQNGVFEVQIGGSDGTAMFKMKAGIIHMGVQGGGTFTIDKDGPHFTGNAFDCACANGNLGVLGVIPPPPGTNSILKGPLGMSGTPSAFWTVASLLFWIVVEALFNAGRRGA